MIISASRRTDIPAFYTKWFINRIKAGYCAVPNPFNRKQISYISLQPEDVETIVFWTRNPQPFLSSLIELDSRNIPYYFQFTFVNNPPTIDPHTPSFEKTLQTFIQLSELIGPQRVIWRYDPIVLSNITSPQFHVENYMRIAEALRGYARRSVISIVDDYRKSSKRMRELGESGVTLERSVNSKQLDQFIPSLVKIAGANNMEIVSCAENINLAGYGVTPGKCIDDHLIKKIFKFDVTGRKDPSQRKECGCVVSRDIGMYDSCLFGCRYCYATQSFELAQRNFKEHKPESPSLVGWYDAEPPEKKRPKKKKPSKQNPKQLKLF